ncbi:exocyst complex component EXO70H1-like [Phragmites australis]|uniref:exocyst complex component EXO70H1-like n=1 Tax=Phragmites australis TaxID=29695 RepID=UPI002D777674|nr:exocyst complex component EXO70H1-like [Phragmites australis]
MPRAFASSSPLRHALPPPRHRRTLSSTLIDETVAAAAALVQKWHPDTPDACSLFLHAADHAEPNHFLRAVADLHRAMLFFASHASYSGHGLVQAQALLQTAMRRLDLELQLLLDDHDIIQGDATSSIRQHICAVAEAMMAAGYGKECLSTFKSRRRAALAATLQRLLGSFTPPPGNSHFYKLTWDQVDAKIIQPWLAAATVAFNSLFDAEKELCDTVFAGDAAVGEVVFGGIANDQATNLLAVAEAAVARARRAPERLFRVLDVHDTLTKVLPAILSVFGDNSEVATRAAVVITKAGQAARGTLASFETAIQKEPSKATAPGPGGAVHPLTRYVMNYLVFLADYEEALALIYQQEGAYTSPDSSTSSSSTMSSWSSPISRLVLVLVCKLDSKAGSYREAALSYLFLSNNTHYVAGKVRGSSKLQGILGEKWAEAQSAKARGHVEVYVRAAWGKVLTAISCTPSPSRGGGGGGGAEGVEEAVMEAVAMQDQWVAADDEMGKALRAAATAAVIPKYRMFYRRYGAAVRLTPGDVTTMIAALFGDTARQLFT